MYIQVRCPEQENRKGSGRLLAQRGASKILKSRLPKLTFVSMLIFHDRPIPKMASHPTLCFQKTTQNPSYLYLVLYFGLLQKIASQLMLCFQSPPKIHRSIYLFIICLLPKTSKIHRSYTDYFRLCFPKPPKIHRSI